jgi:predicted  nucleic acid-binding Zn-ribbon protein
VNKIKVQPRDKKKFLNSQTEILELKNTMNEIKTLIENFNSRLNKAEEKNLQI